MRLGPLAARWLCALALFCGPPAQAAFEATPFGGYRVGGELEDREAEADAEVDEAGSYGFAFNLDETGRTQWELLLARQQTRLQTDEPFAGEPAFDLRVDYYHIGGTYLFNGERLRPYIVATLGATRFSPRPAQLSSETRFSMSIGAGIRYLASEHVGIRAELRGFGTLFDGETELFCGSIGGQGACAVRVDSSLLTQVEAWTGIVFRF